MNAELRIGTSGWHYRHWGNCFYPAQLPSSAMLAWYANKYDTVEINNTFYRLPAEDALLRSREVASLRFLFSVKASRFITHIKRLREAREAISLFVSRVELLGDTLGPIFIPVSTGVEGEHRSACRISAVASPFSSLCGRVSRSDLVCAGYPGFAARP
jgi:uncharacterized protein YecE (DUF72 family)